MGLLDRLWSAISETLFDDMRAPGSGIEDARRRAQAMAPVVWLLGKTGAGKTAIVAALTGDPRAEIGQGFEPCTRAAAFYDVPPVPARAHEFGDGGQQVDGENEQVNHRYRR